MSVTRLCPVALALVVFAGCSDEDSSGIKRTAFPDLVVEPTQIVLPAVAEGSSTSKSVTLRNAGGSRLIITEIYFDNAIDRSEFTKQHPQTRFELAGGEEATLVVSYAPRDLGTDSGYITIVSNDRDQPELRIPIVTTAAESNLLVTPDRLLFDATDPVAQTKTVKLQNIGTSEIAITAVRLSSDTDADFTLSTNADELPALRQGDEIEYGVTYTPTGGDTDFGKLVIETDDVGRPIIEIPLEGIEPRPDISVSPPSVVFGAVDLNSESDVVIVAIENIGNAPLNVESIDFGLAPGRTNQQFSLHELPDAWPLVIGGGEVVQIGVSYHPDEDGNHATSIAIRSDDPEERLVTVPVSGRVRKPCISVTPEALDFGRIAADQESARVQLQVVNCGDLPLNLSEITIEGQGFEWAPPEGMNRQDIAVEPLDSVGLSVWFTNDDLPEDELREGLLTIANNTLDRPEVEVPLSVVGGGAPTCDMLIIPNRRDFGLAARGENRTRSVDAVNRGTGRCEVRNEQLLPLIDIPIPGFNQVPFVLTRPLGRRNVAPAEFAPVDITFRPQVYGNFAARYVVTYWDPFDNVEKMTEAQVVGIAGDNSIEVIPGRLDFGQVTAGECASREERVTVYNTGIVDLCIQDIRLDPNQPGCAEFVIVDRPVANADGCIIVTRNHPADVLVVYEPDNLGADTCDLIFVSNDQETPQRRVPLQGEGVRDRRQTDVFEQTSGRTVDILFVIDNSGSMQDEQDNLRNNFNDFIRGAQQFQNDFQLGVTTTDMDNANHKGRLQGNPRVMRRGPDVERQFQATAAVGTNGAGEEKGLAAAHAALSDPLAFDTGVACGGDGDCVAPDRCVDGRCGGHNRGFLREDAALEVVFLSDEDDYSPGTLNFYVDFLKNIKGFRNEGRLHAHAIVGARGGAAAACQGPGGNADAGRRYVEVANRTNGGVFSICDADFSNHLRDIGNQAFGLQVQFFLSRPAVRATIEVTVDGRRRNDGWDYDEASNSVIFHEATVPQPGQIISITYEAACFPRHD